MLVNTIFMELPDYTSILCTIPHRSVKTWIMGLAVQSINK